jgi:hypothetical protein
MTVSPWARHVAEFARPCQLLAAGGHFAELVAASPDAAELRRLVAESAPPGMHEAYQAYHRQPVSPAKVPGLALSASLKELRGLDALDDSLPSAPSQGKSSSAGSVGSQALP